MKYKIFKIPMQNPDMATEELNAFCSTHAIETVEKRFVENADSSYWAFCITWIETQMPSQSASQYSKSANKIDYQNYFDKAEDFALFDALRQLRNTLAKGEGVPAYSIFTNAQLAAIIDKKVLTKDDLKVLDGIGVAKLEKYGDSVVALIAEVRQAQTANRG